jgi:hypothetical protein
MIVDTRAGRHPHLVTISGDDTALSSRTWRALAGLHPSVHVRNDRQRPAAAAARAHLQLQTARHVGAELVRGLMEDAGDAPLASSSPWAAGQPPHALGKAKRGAQHGRRGVPGGAVCCPSAIVGGAIVKRRAAGPAVRRRVLAEGLILKARSAAGRPLGRRTDDHGHVRFAGRSRAQVRPRSRAPQRGTSPITPERRLRAALCRPVRSTPKTPRPRPARFFLVSAGWRDDRRQGGDGADSIRRPARSDTGKTKVRLVDRPARVPGGAHFPPLEADDFDRLGRSPRRGGHRRPASSAGGSVLGASASAS